MKQTTAHFLECHNLHKMSHFTNRTDLPIQSSKSRRAAWLSFIHFIPIEGNRGPHNVEDSDSSLVLYSWVYGSIISSLISSCDVLSSCAVYCFSFPPFFLCSPVSHWFIIPRVFEYLSPFFMSFHLFCFCHVSQFHISCDICSCLRFKTFRLVILFSFLYFL